MTKVKKVGEIYKCEVCGNVVEVIEVGGGELVCCGQPMKLKKESL
jgi:desulfoferrodoxin-like iron-binding protein